MLWKYKFRDGKAKKLFLNCAGSEGLLASTLQEHFRFSPKFLSEQCSFLVRGHGVEGAYCEPGNA